MFRFFICKYAASLFFILSMGMVSLNVYAFSCPNNGTQSVGVDFILPDTNEMVLVSDMSTYTTCEGNVGPTTENDALRTKSFTVSSILVNQGYMGYFQTPSSTFPDTTSIPICVWPSEEDINCTPVSQTKDNMSEPLALKIYIKRVGITTTDDVVLKAGTEIARISLDQRSWSQWGWTRTWIFILNNDVPIPAHTCSLDDSTPSSVNLDPVSNSSLTSMGSTSKTTDFNIKLKCQGSVDISLLLAGKEPATISGIGVLDNNDTGSSPASGVGLQILFDNSPVKFGQTFYAGASTTGIYDIPMQVRYYRISATPVKGGDVTASLTYNLTYK